MSRNHILMVISAAVVTLAAAQTSAVQAAEDFYKGKRVTLYISSGTGGTVDLMNRLGASHLGKHLPGNPNVIAKNMNGAGGLVGMNYVYNRAPKDGTAIGGSLMSVAFAPLYYGNTGPGKNVKFDPTKFNWIASPVRFVNVAVAWHTSKVKTWKDLYTHELIVGASGIASSATVDAIFLKNLLGFKYKIILGYKSGGDTDLAILRGEIEGRATPWSALTNRHPEWLTKKMVSVLYQQGLEHDSTVPKSVPLLLDLVDDPHKKELLKLAMAKFDMGYPVYAPPGVPKERVAVLRKAFWDTYKDPSYLADAKKGRLLIGPIKPERLTEIIKDSFAAPEPIKAELRRLVVPQGKLERVKRKKKKKKEK
jgi:tripartite-type tricarboxylate transporter receptor subunit TctC